MVSGTLKGWTRIVAAVAVCGTLATNGQAEVRLPAVFGSHMVLQQDKPVIVWGWADPGEKVSVEIGTDKQSTKANERGEWRVTLPARKAGGPFEMIVTGTNRLKLEDVMAGEVWLCSGQSNMQMDVVASQDAEKELANADYPDIRLFLVPRKPAPEPQKDVEASWDRCSSATLSRGDWKGFSAAGYFFGRELHKELKVPVGLIASSWGGTRIEPWTPPEGFAMTPGLRELNDKLLLGNPCSPQHKQRLKKALDDVNAWLGEARKALKDETLVPEMPPYPAELLPPKDHGSPMALYFGMIHPLVPFGIRGAIWYQGESNHGEKDYADKTRALVGGWRKVWGGEDFPFYYVQIAPFQYGEEPASIVPEFWEQQTAALSIPNTGMIVTTDISDLKDIHPRNKQEVGRRLALQALAKTYGRTSLVCSGPEFKSMAIEDGAIRVKFASVGGGLASRDGKPLNWFEIIDADEGGFVQAEARIDGDSVVLTAPGVKQPVAVRFAWSKLAEPNLMNKEGLPANSFRAGKVPVRDGLAKVDEAKDYKLVYDLDISKVTDKVAYTTDNRKKVKGPFDRIAYCLELGDDKGDVKYMYVSVDAFTDDLGKIGVPTAATKAFFQQGVAKMNVMTNVAGVTTGTELAEGNIEFWPNSYDKGNAKSVPNASDSVFDSGDNPTGPVDGYGSMQIHNRGAGQTLFAYNTWKSGDKADLGIGNSPKGNPDWTFEKNASNYPVRRLRVLVRPADKQ